MAVSRPSTPRRQRRATGSSLISKLMLLACVLVALFCFMPMVKAEEKENDYGTVIGIDLGTTYSCVA